MKRGVLAILALSMAALIAGGCAKKEVVKGEEAVAPKEAPVKAEAPQQKSEVKQAADVKPAAVEAARQAEQSAAKASSAVGSALENVYFDFDKSDLRKDSREVLNKNAEFLLKSKPSAKVQIEGHCDERGSAEYNIALGERRAKSSLQYLITLGVKADRLSTISYGKEKPAVQGSNEAAWAKNRRDEFKIQ